MATPSGGAWIRAAVLGRTADSCWEREETNTVLSLEKGPSDGEVPEWAL